MREQHRRSTKGKTVAAFALGATIGSLVALLYAPASGKVTRQRLAMRARDARRDAQRKLAQARKQLVHRAEAVRENATEWIQERMQNGHARRPARRAAHA